MAQARKALIYTLTVDLDPLSLSEPLSTHLTLTGAQRAQRRYHLWTTHGMKYRDSRIVSYITTEHSPDTIRAAIDDLTQRISEKQLAALVVWQLPNLTPYTPKSHLKPPHKRDSTQAAHYRKHRKALATAKERATAAHLQESEILGQIEMPSAPILGNSK